MKQSTFVLVVALTLGAVGCVSATADAPIHVKSIEITSSDPGFGKYMEIALGQKLINKGVVLGQQGPELKGEISCATAPYLHCKMFVVGEGYSVAVEYEKYVELGSASAIHDYLVSGVAKNLISQLVARQSEEK